MKANTLVLTVFVGTITIAMLTWLMIDLLTEDDQRASGASAEEKLVSWAAPVDYVFTPPPLPTYNRADNEDCKFVIDGLYEDAVINQAGVQ